MHTPRRSWVLTVWRCLPGITVFTLLLFPHIITAQAGPIAPIMPPMPLLAIYYWCVMHPRRMGWYLPLTAGLANDALTGLPLGLSAVLWLIFRFFATAGRKDVQESGFLVSWGYAALCLFAMLLGQWVVLAMYHYRTFSIGVLFLQWLLAMLLYPSLHLVLFDIEKRFHRRYWFVLKAT